MPTSSCKAGTNQKLCMYDWDCCPNQMILWHIRLLSAPRIVHVSSWCQIHFPSHTTAQVSKAVMLLLSLVMWANSTNPVITVEEETKHLFLPVYHMTQQHATVWLQIMTNLQLLATRVCDYHVVMLWLYHPTTFMSVKSTHLAQQHFQKYCASVSIHPTPLRGR